MRKTQNYKCLRPRQKIQFLDEYMEMSFYTESFLYYRLTKCHKSNSQSICTFYSRIFYLHSNVNTFRRVRIVCLFVNIYISPRYSFIKGHMYTNKKVDLKN